MNLQRLFGALTRVLVVVVIACTPAFSAVAASSERALEQPRKARKPARSVERPHGREGDPRRVRRVVTIDMSDTMRFFPSEFRVKRGETVRFMLRNVGQSTHAMVIGTMDDLKKQAGIVKNAGTVERLGAHAVQVLPGETGRLVWQFTRPGEFYYACLMPGHFEAGMIGTIVVR